MLGKETHHFNSSTDSCGDSPLKFWEMDSCFKCPVVGLCLTSSEQEKILRKAGVRLKSRNEFEMHEILVTSAETDNRLSRKVDHFLSLKFGAEVFPLRLMKEEAFMERFKNDFNAGEYSMTFWTAATRPCMSERLKREIFGMIHMSMHANVEAHACDRRLVKHLEEEMERQTQRVRTINIARKHLEKEREHLTKLLETDKAELAGLRRENELLYKKIEILQTRKGVSDIEAENRRLKDEISEKAIQIEIRDRALNDQKKICADLLADLESQRRENEQFKQEIQNTLHDFLDIDRCNIACPAFDLCQKRILIVGGIIRMEALYRRLIEEAGGVFEYHDGYMQGGTKQLENSMKRADIVLCPVNCNSHNACSLVKNLGKKYNTPVHMLANFSLSAVTQALAGNS